MSSSDRPAARRFVCLHGHFYQPPRENPWLEAVQVQDSAYPYHDWNERITDECYAQNARSRILDEEGYIESIVNNYASINFDFGPTLLAWLETEKPDVYASIVEADRISCERHAGHGAAMAQAYNHAILPLCDARDRRTQVRWGVRDFERRFGRAPEGMWLPETAVDLASLETLADEGIRFTVLEPHQASRWRPMGGERWISARDGGLDPRRPYRCTLPSGRSIDLLFYDGPISRAVAFDALLSSGVDFANRLAGAFADRPEAQLVHVATDGETYGHHHRFGDMALAFALRHIEQRGLAQLTTYARYLALHPPGHEVEIAEQTSWSCAHGVERWRSGCGCGAAEGGSTAWRAPLREALDWLRDTLRPPWERAAAALLDDPWAARDDYVDLVLDREPSRVDAFFDEHARGALGREERVAALELLELQRYAMLMYTSCGWFFEDLARIETVQVLRYAARAIELAERRLGSAVERPFLERLSKARSNEPDLGDGGDIWRQRVAPTVVSLGQVTAHYAISSLFEDYGESPRIYCYRVRDDERVAERAGAARLAQGRARVESTVTGEDAELVYCAVHLGDHGLVAGVQRPQDGAGETSLRQVREAFGRADIPETLRRMERAFPEGTYTLRSLFRDEQRRIVDRIVASSVRDATGSQRLIFERHGPLMRHLAGLDYPMPAAFRAAAELALAADLHEALEAELPEVQRARAVLDEAERLRLQLDGGGLRRGVEQSLERLAERLVQNPQDRTLLDRLDAIARLAPKLAAEPDLWAVQNRFWSLTQTAWPEHRRRAEQGERDAIAWSEAFRALGRTLRVRVPT